MVTAAVQRLRDRLRTEGWDVKRVSRVCCVTSMSCAICWSGNFFCAMCYRKSSCYPSYIATGNPHVILSICYRKPSCVTRRAGMYRNRRLTLRAVFSNNSPVAVFYRNPSVRCFTDNFHWPVEVAPRHMITEGRYFQRYHE